MYTRPHNFKNDFFPTIMAIQNQLQHDFKIGDLVKVSDITLSRHRGKTGEVIQVTKCFVVLDDHSRVHHKNIKKLNHVKRNIIEESPDVATLAKEIRAMRIEIASLRSEICSLRRNKN